MSERTKIPQPGSDGAIEMGCICPVLDNGHGRGYLGDGERFGYVINGGCPLHGVNHDRPKPLDLVEDRPS